MSQSPLDPVDRSQRSLYREATDRWSRLIRAGSSHSGYERNCVFLNTTGEQFADISAISGLDWIDDARAVVAVDWDHDGDQDLWISNRTAPQLRFMRNNHGSPGDSISLRLIGRSCNRDAIGARVDLRLEGESQSQVRWLSAGSGFLSQSSSWLHFALPEGATVASLAVRWPDGEVQRVQGVTTAGRYELAQSVAAPLIARRASRGRPSVNLVESDPVKLPLPPAEALRLASRPPSPMIDYEGWSGESTRWKVQRGRPALLNLWASWCGPCAVELQELTQQAPELRARGLQLLALTVDGLGDQRSADRDSLQATLQQIGFPFGSGLATPTLIDKLELLYTNLFGRHTSFPVPTSFLIDGQGRLATIYLGRIEPETLLQDLERLDSTAEELRQLSTPFVGSWSAPPLEFDAAQLSREYLRAGFAVDAEPLLRDELRENPRPETPQLLATALSLLGRRDEAESLYRQAISGDPAAVRPHYNLALLLENQGRKDDAVAEFQTTLRLDPRHTQAHYELANLLQKMGRPAEAVSHYRRALELKPGWGAAGNALARQLAATSDPQLRDSDAAIRIAEGLCRATEYSVPELMDTLAISYAAGGRFDEAVTLATRAVRLARDAGRTVLAEEIDRRVELFRREEAWVSGPSEFASSP